MTTKIKAIAMDVDGVLTDNIFIWGADGSEHKRFCYADRTGIRMAVQRGFKFTLISGETSYAGGELARRFAEKCGIKVHHMAWHDKGEALEQFAEACGVKLAQVAFIGNDLMDIPALRIAGYSACPADAELCAREAALVTLSRKGGHGAVRELIDILLADPKTENLYDA